MITVMDAQRMYCPHMANKCKSEACMFWRKHEQQNRGECLLVEHVKLSVPDIKVSTVAVATEAPTPKIGSFFGGSK